VAWSHNFNWAVVIDFMWSAWVWGLYYSECCLRAKIGVHVSEGCMIFNAVGRLNWCKCALIRMNSCAALNQWICTQWLHPLVITWDEVTFLGCYNLCHVACPFFEGCSQFLLPDGCIAFFVSFKAFFSCPLIGPLKRIYMPYKHCIYMPRLGCGNSTIRWYVFFCFAIK